MKHEGYLTVGEAAAYLGIASVTLRRWDEEERIITTRTAGQHRLISIEEAETSTLT